MYNVRFTFWFDSFILPGGSSKGISNKDGWAELYTGKGDHEGMLYAGERNLGKYMVYPGKTISVSLRCRMDH